MPEQRGFFDLDERRAALSRAGDPLERLSAMVDFELFRPQLCAIGSRPMANEARWTLKRGRRKRGPDGDCQEFRVWAGG